LRAAEIALEDKLCQPILIGRPDIIEQRLVRYGLSIRPGKDFEVINPERDDRYRDYVNTLLEVSGRNGITPDAAKSIVRTSTTAIGALAIIRNDADALICGLEGRFIRHKQYIEQIIGRKPGVTSLHAMSLLIDQRRAVFMTDTYISEDPDAQQIAEMTRLAAKEIERFGITPKAALLSASDFGSRPMPTASIMREAAEILARTDPDLEVDGEMHADTALDETVRNKVYPLSRLKGRANLLVFPNLDAANITMNAVKATSDGLHVGPIILGTRRPAHILAPAVTSRGVLNMTALAAVQAIQLDEEA
jgi:malate dehydrogenase (oxaloacetate-decarboxylating)(NADP+)